MLSFEDFCIAISEFLIDKDWEISEENARITFTKNYNSNIKKGRNLKYLLNDDLFYKRLINAFRKIDLPKITLDSIKNENADTDFIIAGLQIANRFLASEDIGHRSFYAFQPVIRLNKKDICGKQEGFLTSFINLCTVDINTSLEEYISRIDDWITILSKLSLHTSGLKLTLKNMQDDVRNYNGFNFSNGMKLQFSYNNVVIGVANLFQVDCNGQNILLSDFGFGYENLLWSINGPGDFFKPLFPNFEILYGDYIKNDRVRTSTLITLSGIVPSANGPGSKTRGMIAEVCGIYDGSNVVDMVAQYYSYYARFITPQVSLYDTQDIILNEVERNKKKIIAFDKSSSKTFDKSVDDLCREIIINDEIELKEMEIE